MLKQWENENDLQYAARMRNLATYCGMMLDFTTRTSRLNLRASGHGSVRIIGHK